ncbi:cysteine hydrolase family protein [Yinghuangia soli]|uniref:Isochorismatase family protein n=1 Tax=Yinghuangia soli TaxID=2908204 RepID=A0AA41U0T2_9ACTN|nr:isochorismatase family protein [Yinghuangia soli]MCF2528795.1 isochorismatase family protein [Yinghuangia soli]
MNRALIVVDVQESFRQTARWETISAPDIADRVNRLVRLAREAGDLVVWVLHAEPGSGDEFDPALGKVKLFGELERRNTDPVVYKNSHNAFTTTNLQQLLTMHAVYAVTICGIRTEQCVETTTRVASDFGYPVTFVVDATATNPIPHRDLPADASTAEILADPRTLGAEQVIERTVYALAGRFATIATVAELEAEAAAEASAEVPAVAGA